MIKNKRYWLEEAFKNGEYIFKSKIITLDKFLNVISKKEYNLIDELQVSRKTVTRLLKRVFPGRPVSSRKVCN